MTKENYDVIIIGAGPAGIFTAIELTKKNKSLKILIVDKGREINKRKCPSRNNSNCVKCEPCAIVNRWSGAGAYSDGKSSLGCYVGGNVKSYLGEEETRKLIEYADKIYPEFGAQQYVYGLNHKRVDEVSYEASKHDIELIPCPVRHLGTEKAFDVLGGMYNYLINHTNVKFRELTTVSEVICKNQKAIGVKLQTKGQEPKTVMGRYIVAAPGSGGSEWLNKQAQEIGIKTINNVVDIGVRVEVPNSIMDHLTKELYEAKFVYYSDTFDNKVRTFCMNPGGVVSEEHYEGHIAIVNGHSYADEQLKTQNTNFAMLVSTTKPTLKAAVPGDLSFAIPHRHLMSIIEALKALDKMAPGLYSRNILLYSCEIKF